MCKYLFLFQVSMCALCRELVSSRAIGFTMIESKLITLEISMSHNSLDHSRSSGKERNSFFHLIERRVARCRTIGMGNARQETAWFQKLHGSQRKRILSLPPCRRIFQPCSLITAK